MGFRQAFGKFLKGIIDDMPDSMEAPLQYGPDDTHPGEKYFDVKPDKPLDWDKAQALFNDLAAMKGMVLNYLHDGCHARTHLMAKELQERGETPSKAWVFSEGDNMYEVKLPGMTEAARWSWHVAPALPVRMPDGSVEKMVFDASLFDGPVTVEKWAGTIGAKPEETHVAPLGKRAGGRRGDYDTFEDTRGSTDYDAQNDLANCMVKNRKNKEPHRTFESGFADLVQSRQQSGPSVAGPVPKNG